MMKNNNEKTTYGVISFLDKCYNQVKKRLHPSILNFINSQNVCYYMEESYMKKFSEGKKVPFSRVFIVLNEVSNSGQSVVVTLAQIKRYVDIGENLTFILENGIPLDDTFFSTINYFYDLHQRVNVLLEETCPKVLKSDIKKHQFMIAGDSYLKPAVQSTLKIIFITLRMLQGCKLPTCIVRDIINAWKCISDMDISIIEDMDEFSRELTTVYELDLDNNVGKETKVFIVGEYQIESNYTKAGKTKILVPSTLNHIFKLKSQIDPDKIIQTEGYYSIYHTYLLGKCECLITSSGVTSAKNYGQLHLIIPKSEDLIYYSKPKTYFEVASIISDVIYSLHLKTAYFSI